MKLTVLRGPAQSPPVLLRRPVAILGARPGCKLQLRHPAISSLHCAVVNTGHKVYLRDLLSTTGVFLNDLRAEHELLDDGDTLRAGPWEFRVGLADASAHDEDDFTGINLEPAPAGVGLERTDIQKLIKLPREVSLIGRKNGCDVLLEDRHVSRVHALIFEYLGHPAVADLLSENGLLVSGKRTHFALLDGGVELQMGPHTLITRVAPPMSHLRAEAKRET